MFQMTYSLFARQTQHSAAKFPTIILFRQKRFWLNWTKSMFIRHPGLMTWVLQDFAPLLCEPLCAVFNASAREGRVPSLWKHANVLPIPKVKPPKSIQSVWFSYAFQMLPPVHQPWGPAMFRAVQLVCCMRACSRTRRVRMAWFTTGTYRSLPTSSYRCLWRHVLPAYVRLAVYHSLVICRHRTHTGCCRKKCANFNF